ncbi:PspA/IM30 family protein [Vibrio splendidus]|uniref:PspA/IM30 family protein n=1 Tax=Vibrio splendidus TaxID=29497 RepID=UPI000C85DA68|nr:PspA/IM30 family protein [Vibrio splendidus]PMM11207.1 phage shock protein A [Vibrio splendidus]PMN31033.1 phage shock protein A [Vibrio splendidus]
MSVLKKLFTVIRGGAREVGESIVDANSIRVFEQEIKDAEHEIEKAKRELTEVMAQEMQAARKVESLTKDVESHEGYATRALEKGDEALALEIAQKLIDIQSELQIQQQAQANFASHIERLKAMIKKTTQALTDMQRQLVMVKTTESVQKATTAITNNYASGSSKLLTAKESLERIKQKQQDLDDRMAAGEILSAEFNGDDLEAKMKAAGIIENDNKAQDLLDKLKTKKSN